MLAYPVAQDENSAAVCLMVTRFATGTLPLSAAATRIPLDPMFP